jgi:FimV-like protein
MSLSLNHFYRFTLAFAGFFLTASAWALQISQPFLMSRLGEPLKLQFIVNEVSEAEQQLLTISVAEPKVYESTQIKRMSGIDGITFEITKQANGDYLVTANGSRPMVDERADLIIDFDWATGRRFMNISLDIQSAPLEAASMATTAPAQAANQPLGPAPNQDAPVAALAPTQAPAPAEAPATAQAPVDAPPPPAEAAPDPTTSSETENKASAPESAVAQEPAAAVAAATSIEVQKGDTASKLLAGLDIADISLDQLLLAMLQQNAAAFVDNNVNRLKAGALITLPSPADAAAFDRKEARDNIRLQAADFQAYRASLGSSAPVAKQTTGSQRESSGKLKADMAAPANTPADQLTLSKPSDSEAEKLSKQLQDEENAKQAKEVSDNLSQLGELSQAASTFSQGFVGRFPALSASYQQGMVWAQQHVFELIAGAALLAAFLVSFSLMRDGRQRAGNARHENDDDTSDHTPSGFSASDDDSAQKSLHLPAELNLDLDDMPDKHASHAPQGQAPAEKIDLPAFPVDSTPTVIDHGEDPFVMRLELAEELWKLGQKQTALALSQEVADQTHGETRELAQRWLNEHT